jgi:hypothetical protein
MPSSENRLVSLDSRLDVEVTTGPEGAEVWTRQVRFDASTPGTSQWPASSPRPSQARWPPGLGAVGWLHPGPAVRRDEGSPAGDGHLIDELVIPLLDPTGRRDYLSQCTESVPQIVLACPCARGRTGTARPTSRCRSDDQHAAHRGLVVAGGSGCIKSSAAPPRRWESSPVLGARTPRQDHGSRPGCCPPSEPT